jgi:mutator protein MutT
MEKRRVSVLVPYKIENNSVYLFMQRRAKDHARGGNMFGFFGGGIQELETPEEALMRESKEELNIIPKNFYLFKKYDLPATTYFSESELYLFALPVDENFEKSIKILLSEGQYGVWFSKEDYLKNKELIAGNLFIMDELYNQLS